MAGYYEILELRCTATKEDIKRAYRRLALRWHPDKNPENLEEANRRFKEISEAYEVLIDERKKSIYDQYGKEGLQTFHAEKRYKNNFNPCFTGPFMFRNAEEVFREFFRTTSFEFPNPIGVSVHLGPSVHSHPSSNSIRPPFFGSFEFHPFGFPRFNNSFQVLPGSFTWFNTNRSRVGSISTMIRQTSISTQFIHGKKITIQRIFENGMEIIMAYENGVLRSKTVNGVPQLIIYS
ncbi:dnaJ homolog subfamily B member 6-like [Bombus pyrosoma]|uniref:dnaJ homolog subfamily B member 6-like n=1 Tax=Bombus pyrosoma TaxID=396416 RepID=UPI001CB8CD76|nr:dnaJ homolog subfamily B member 6-like [Bombus pyrosoma]XP_043604258.1 dnaJ homolog subfamily B member 6-like [Bombus pyrosoma]XP_043604259.1 dnaJ homolog subfamily B member 6-like [Bombus pyrosoma]XP_043604260.1 dnaJ homolog subfamily B member 6-like [Bombus pyrosoma]